MSMGRFLVHGAILLLISALVYLLWRSDLLSPGNACTNCDGAGFFRVWMEDAHGPVGAMKTEDYSCGRCGGSGKGIATGEKIQRLLPQVTLLLWRGIWVVLAAGLAWGLKTVDCRLCRGKGRLTLEALPPGRSAFTMNQDCVGCGGRGRLGALDRWLFWRGWEQAPEPAWRPHRRRPLL